MKKINSRKKYLKSYMQEKSNKPKRKARRSMRRQGGPMVRLHLLAEPGAARRFLEIFMYCTFCFS
jgi:hypothetical protein